MAAIVPTAEWPGKCLMTGGFEDGRTVEILSAKRVVYVMQASPRR